MAEDAQRSEAVFVISVAAELTGVHPQTLRIYERRGLIEPYRTPGGTRRYSRADLERLELIQALTEAGLNLEGVKRVMKLKQEIEELRKDVAEMKGARSRRWPKRPSGGCARSTAATVARSCCTAGASPGPGRTTESRHGGITKVRSGCSTPAGCCSTSGLGTLSPVDERPGHWDGDGRGEPRFQHRREGPSGPDRHRHRPQRRGARAQTTRFRGQRHRPLRRSRPGPVLNGAARRLAVHPARSGSSSSRRVPVARSGPRAPGGVA